MRVKELLPGILPPVKFQTKALTFVVGNILAKSSYNTLWMKRLMLFFEKKNSSYTTSDKMFYLLSRFQLSTRLPFATFAKFVLKI